MRTDYVSFNDVQQGTVPADPLLSMPALPVTSLKEEVTESALHSQVHQLLPGAHYRCQMRNFNADLGAKLRGISGRIYSHRSVSKAFFRHAKGLSPEEKQAIREQRRARWEAMTPEQRADARQRMQRRAGHHPGRGHRGGQRGSKGGNTDDSNQ